MSIVRILLGAEATVANRAVRSTAYRHQHIAARPFVVSAYNLSGEAAAPLGFCYGTSRKKFSIVIAPEPRNRDSRFGAINSFAAGLVEYLQPFLALKEEWVGREHRLLRVALDAPQIVTPNRATRDYIGARLGRSLRYLGLGDTHEVPEATQWAGAHLSWLAEHSLFPGQSIFLAATELLGKHFVTGQSDFENENLASLLAWIDNEPGRGRAPIRAAEDAAFGPVPDPSWEVHLEPLVRQWTVCDRGGDLTGRAAVAKKIEAIVAPKLRESYDATWNALAKAEAIVPAPSVTDRWDLDVRLWGGHARRCEHGIPRFAKRHDPLRASRMLEEWSRALERLEFREAVEDPMILAELDAVGRCISGHVKSVDLDNREVKPGNKRATQVPILEITLEGSSNLLVEDEIIWTAEVDVKGEVRSIDQNTAVVAVTGGHKFGTRLPKRNQAVIFAALSMFGGNSPDDPQSFPWTHRPPSDLEEAATPADAVGDGTPDLTPAELADLPIVGAVGPDDVPGVVL